jgi:hypothetical protein
MYVSPVSRWWLAVAMASSLHVDGSGTLIIEPWRHDEEADPCLRCTRLECPATRRYRIAKFTLERRRTNIGCQAHQHAGRHVIRRGAAFSSGMQTWAVYRTSARDWRCRACIAWAHTRVVQCQCRPAGEAAPGACHERDPRRAPAVPRRIVLPAPEHGSARQGFPTRRSSVARLMFCAHGNSCISATSPPFPRVTQRW